MTFAGWVMMLFFGVASLRLLGMIMDKETNVRAFPWALLFFLIFVLSTGFSAMIIWGGLRLW